MADPAPSAPPPPPNLYSAQPGPAQISTAPLRASASAAACSAIPTASRPDFKEIVLSEHDLCIASNVPGQVTFLVLVVHGIGPQGDKSIVEHLNRLTRVKDYMMMERFKSVAHKLSVEFRSFDWHGSFRQQNPELDEALGDLSPGEPNPLRNVLNSHLMDVVFYRSGYRAAILKEVVDKLNQTYALYTSEQRSRPPGQTYVALYGHSLGSVIAYDIVSNHSEQLQFPIHSLFVFGSPLGMFLSTQGFALGALPRIFPSESPAAGHVKLYNVYHPHDPLAYRVEPFSVAELEKCKAVKLPHWKTYGERRIKEGLAAAAAGGLAGAAIAGPVGAVVGFGIGVAVGYGAKKVDGKNKGKAGDSSETPPDTPTQDPPSLSNLAIRGGNDVLEGRYDYVLQPAAEEKANPFLSMTSAHNNYWEDRDSMFFMLTQLIRNTMLVTGAISPMGVAAAVCHSPPRAPTSALSGPPPLPNMGAKPSKQCDF